MFLTELDPERRQVPTLNPGPYIFWNVYNSQALRSWDPSPASGTQHGI